MSIVGLTTISLDDSEKGKKKKVPRRILHFSDGILEEYSTDEEEEDVPPVKVGCLSICLLLLLVSQSLRHLKNKSKTGIKCFE